MSDFWFGVLCGVAGGVVTVFVLVGAAVGLYAWFTQRYDVPAVGD